MKNVKIFSNEPDMHSVTTTRNQRMKMLISTYFNIYICAIINNQIIIKPEKIFIRDINLKL
jgi:hypothetical protein